MKQTILRMVAGLGVVAGLVAIPAQPSQAAALQFTTISIGNTFACGVATTNSVYCWGSNSYGQLGDGTTTNRFVPTTVSTAQLFVTVTVGSYHACGVTVGDAVYCWGWNGQGNLGTGNYSSSTTPVLVSGGHNWRSVAAGASTTCGVTTAGAGYCWGNNSSGTIGNGGTTISPSPTAVSGSLTWRSIRISNGLTACGVDTSDNGYCWGGNNLSQVGDGGTSSVLSPFQLAGAWTNVSPGPNSTCGVRTNGDAYCWGQNAYGQLGVGDTSNRTSPALVSGGHLWLDTSMGSNTACGVRVDGSGYCWGYGGAGAIGDGTANNRTSPRAIAGLQVLRSVSVGSSAACAVDVSNLGYCWGENAIGQIGQDTTSPTPATYTSPQPLYSLQVTATLEVTVLPILQFAVSAHSGTCNGVAQSSGSSASSVSASLGSTSPSLNAVAAQDLSITTNAGGGFTVYLRATGGPSESRGHVLADVSGTYSAPVAFPTAGTEAFGFTTSEASLPAGTANRFTAPSARWAPVTTSSVVVSYSSTLPPSTDVVCVAYQAGQSSATPAGAYSATIIYTAVPLF
jgi:alpha-tubulin suppressor-like RCC1 family protein